MKFYLAGGFSIMCTKGRERAYSQKFERWNRLFSFHFKKEMEASDILNIKKDFETKKTKTMSKTT